MDENVGDANGGTELLSPFQTAQLLLDEWKFRQAHCWRLLRTYWMAAAAVSVAPAVSHKLVPSLSGKIGPIIIFGFVLQIFVIWLFHAEYLRCQRRAESYEAILKKHGCGTQETFRKWTARENFFGKKIGYVTSIGFVIISGYIFVFNLLVFWDA